MNPKKITESQANEIIEIREPKGLFYLEQSDGMFTGIDNRTSDAWTEDFETEEECMSWLRRDLIVSKTHTKPKNR